MIKDSESFGSTCSLRPKESRSNFGSDDESTMSILENHGCELIRKRSPYDYRGEGGELEPVDGIVSREINIMQTGIATVLNDLESLTVVRVEDDTDHESGEGYFDWMRTELIKNHAKREIILISSLEKRKRYLTNHTSFEMIKTCKELENIPPTRVFSVLIVDRSHVLGLREFDAVLSKFKSNLKHLYLCGSTLCLPETMGKPFHDIYTSGGVRLEVRFEKQRKSEGIQGQKIREFYPSMRSMVESCKAEGSMYIIAQNKKEKDRLLRKYSSLFNDIGSDSLITLSDLTYEIPTRVTTAIFLSEEDDDDDEEEEERRGISDTTTGGGGGGVKMNKNQMAKCISCATTKPKSVVIIGRDHDMNAVSRNQKSFKNSLLSTVIERTGLSMQQLT